MTSSDMPFLLGTDKGIHNDLKIGEEPGSRVIAKHCGGCNQVTINEDEIDLNHYVATVKYCIFLSEDGHILILICTPSLNCPG